MIKKSCFTNFLIISAFFSLYIADKIGFSTLVSQKVDRLITHEVPNVPEITKKYWRLTIVRACFKNEC